MSLWSRDASSRETLFIYLQVELSLGKLCLQKGWKFIFCLSTTCLESWRSPFQNPQKWEQLTSTSGKSVVMRVFSPHQQQHFIIKRNQKCNFDFKTIFLAFSIEPCDLLDMATWTTEHHFWPSRWEGKRDLNWLVKTSCQWYSALGDFLSSLNVLSNIALLEVLSTYTVLGSLEKDGFEQHTSTGSGHFAFLLSGVAQISR